MTPDDTTTDAATTDLRVELFVRSLAPSGAHERQQAVVSRLERLVSDGRIDTVSTTVWGRRICPEMAADLTVGRSILDRVDRLRTWARRHDASLEPSFDEHVERSMLDGTHTVVVLPVLCLAVFEGDDLRGVFPCVKDGTPCTVEDGLDLLEDPNHAARAPFSDQASAES